MTISDLHNLIDTLSKARLLNADSVKLLHSLNLGSYQQIIALLDSDINKQTIIAISDMIGCSRFVAPKQNWEDTIPAFVRLLDSPDWEIRQKAAETIGRLDAHNQLQVLSNIVVTDDNDYVKMIAIDAIAHWRLPQSAPLLIRLATDANQALQVRETVIEALGVSGTIEAIPTLIALLQDENPAIRHIAIIALHNSQAPIAIPHLEKLLTDETKTRHGPSIADEVRGTINYLRSR